MWGSPALGLRRIQVLGNHRVDASTIARSTDLVRGARLVDLSTSAVELKVERIAWVEHARVERIVPSTVRITVTERKVAATVMIGVTRFLVDATGVILQEGEEGKLLITDLRLPKVTLGQRVELITFRDSLRIAAALPGDIKAALLSVSAPSVDGITLRLNDGVEVRYGAAEEMRDKNYAIEKVLENERSRGRQVAYLDVRDPQRPSVMPRSPSG
ncbi:MAG TPA: FtsQ-type POTRA domain-containing protein [Actinomycetota bacterium]|nr:FtsQ-type POTRA domain-containing protein [Actinomycetota bacterium]